MGIIGSFFNRDKRKILGNFELQDLIQENKNNVIIISKNIVEVDEKIKSIETQVNSIVKLMEEEKNKIPNEYVEVCSKISDLVAGVTIKQVYEVLMAYKTLKEKRIEEVKEKKIEKLQEIKKEVQNKKVYNCKQCGKPVEEGFYFKRGNEKFCLEHLKQKPKEDFKEAL